MKSTIYLVKEVFVRGNEFDSIDVRAFLNEDKALNYVMTELKNYEEGFFTDDEDDEVEVDFEIIEDGFESVIINNDENEKYLYSLDFMNIDNGEIPKEIHLYTEVNTYTSGEICPHALGFLTESDAKQEMISEINDRTNEEIDDNLYWISEGSIEENYVVLEDENGNTSYLECATIYLNN